jgi:hypothetical protein
MRRAGLDVRLRRSGMVTELYASGARSFRTYLGWVGDGWIVWHDNPFWVQQVLSRETSLGGNLVLRDLVSRFTAHTDRYVQTWRKSFEAVAPAERERFKETEAMALAAIQRHGPWTVAALDLTSKPLGVPSLGIYHWGKISGFDSAVIVFKTEQDARAAAAAIAREAADTAWPEALRVFLEHLNPEVQGNELFVADLSWLYVPGCKEALRDAAVHGKPTEQ